MIQDETPRMLCHWMGLFLAASLKQNEVPGLLSLMYIRSIAGPVFSPTHVNHCCSFSNQGGLQQGPFVEKGGLH